VACWLAGWVAGWLGDAEAAGLQGLLDCRACSTRLRWEAYGAACDVGASLMRCFWCLPS